MDIPLFDLNFGKEEEEAIKKTIRSGWISTGPKCEEFESNFSAMFGIKYAVSLSSCTSSLHLALKLVGIKKGDEVICPSLTFVATVNAIRYLEANPIFCDIINYAELNIDPEKIEVLITKKTKAIIVMHYAGFPCRMNKIMAIAKKYKLKVIEDACHGPLSDYNNKKLGTIGDIGCFSFFSNKNISTGEGGMLITNNPDYYKKTMLLRSHGMTSLSYERAKGHTTIYDVVDIGYNYRMDDIRASIGLVQLSKLKKDLKKREKLRKYYVNILLNIEELIIPFNFNKGFVSNYIFPVVLKNSTPQKRNFIRKYMQNKGIQTSVHYPPVHKFVIYKNYRTSLPNTEYVADNEITLPLFSGLTFSHLDYIIENLKKGLLYFNK